MTSPSHAVRFSLIEEQRDPTAEQLAQASVDEWQLLETILVSENGRSILGELRQVV